MDKQTQQALRRLPAVDETVRELEQRWGEGYPRWAVVQAVQEAVERLRAGLLAGDGGGTELDPEALEADVRRLLLPSLRPVYNATGVVVHTNLGRSPLGPRVLSRVLEIASGYSTLEYDLERRCRGSRHVHPAGLLTQLTGAEDAVVVNNNAAAVLLCLAALARDREVVVSRGELIEIGGSFRLPDVMSASGAVLREVGTTNRTHPRDYEGAINEQTALLLKAHTSNFAMVGFTAEVDPRELVAIGQRAGVPVMFDLGSGTLVDLAQLGLPGETTVQQAVEMGFDLVTFSGDKLLGGPQAGIIVGRAEAVQRVRTHPLMRPLRPDKMTLAGLLATLEAYRDGQVQELLPTPAMLAAGEEQLKRRARRLARQLRQALPEPWRFGLVPVDSRVGGGALPMAAPRSWAVGVEHPDQGADAVEALLRAADPPVVARIEQDRLLLDVRTLLPGQVAGLTTAVAEALRGRGG